MAEPNTAESDMTGPEAGPNPKRVAPTWAESLARQASRPFGGPLGRHAIVGRHWFWTAARVILLAAVIVLALAWTQKSPCLQTNWSDGHQYTEFCYSDTIPLYSAERLDKPDTFPYQTSWIDNSGTATEQVRYMEYPVLTGLFQWFNARLAQGYTTLAQSGWLPNAPAVDVYFAFVAVWMATAWLIVVWSATRMMRRRPWDAMLVAISPLVIMQIFTNFDALAVGCATAGLFAWSKQRPVLAGILIGLGGAAKLYPLFLLGPLLVLCWRAGKLKQGGKATLAAVLAWAVVNAPIFLLYRAGWLEFFRLNNVRGADPDSLYNVLSYFTGWPGFDGYLAFNQNPTILNTVSAVLFLGCCAAIGWVAMSAPRRPRLAQLCFLVVAAFLITNKVWSPQYSLWLVPLAVLAIPRWKPLLVWMTIDALMWVPRMLFYLGVAHKGLPEGPFLVMVVIRDLAVLGLCVLILREIYRPEHDLVRRVGVDDQCGGFLEDAPDRRVFGKRKTIGQWATSLT